MLRVRRIVMEEERLSSRLTEMSTKFKQRGYPRQMLAQEAMRVQGLDRESTIQDKSPDRTKSSRIPFVHAYHPCTRKIHHVIYKHWPLLRTAYPDIPEFQEPPLLSYKRPRNLRDRLVQADLGTQRVNTQRVLAPLTNGMFPCGRCNQCSSVIRTNVFTHPHTGKKFELRGHFTCDTEYVVYMLKCPCGLAYVGETVQPIRDRISQHKSTIRKEVLKLPVPAHFHSARHSMATLRFLVLESIAPPRGNLGGMGALYPSSQT
ncbi:uncharacterized protein LOC121403682 [Xenopus laevis]|uniref:Uncharacterized protein LOC121403682 n=1 Tax=Xenopus laevis TaxID=8355 RepID=A0A8J1N140_XENLA|nr:uncharacterized protein LOC121403682 [Xenopus laevis]